jgi:hypothetical protein
VAQIRQAEAEQKAKGGISRHRTERRLTGAAIRTQSTVWEVANLNPFS